jgi:hypothetical protein
MFAPRAFACSSSSSTTRPGALADHEPVAGEVERAAGGLRAVVPLRQGGEPVEPVMPERVIMLCDPPASITSASPVRIISTASPIACELAAHAVWHDANGPSSANVSAR